MEAIVALGFAANVVQFVDFTTRVIFQTIKVYRANSHTDHGEDATDLEEIGVRIERYVAPLEFDAAVKAYLSGKPWVRRSWTQMKNGIHQLHHETVEDRMGGTAAVGHKLLMTTDAITKLSASDKEIIRACIKCEEIAILLQTALNKLKDTRRSKKAGWNSFTEALKSVWSEADLHAVRQRLDNHRQQMTTLLLASVQEKAEASQLQQDVFHKDLYESTKDIRRTMNRLLNAQEQWKICRDSEPPSPRVQ